MKHTSITLADEDWDNVLALVEDTNLGPDLTRIFNSIATQREKAAPVESTDPYMRVFGISSHSVDKVAEIIRRVDGDHSLGAGRLAELLVEELAKEAL